jgi:hypothetical protein
MMKNKKDCLMNVKRRIGMVLERSFENYVDLGTKKPYPEKF